MIGRVHIPESSRSSKNLVLEKVCQEEFVVLLACSRVQRGCSSVHLVRPVVVPWARAWQHPVDRRRYPAPSSTASEACRRRSGSQRRHPPLGRRQPRRPGGSPERRSHQRIVMMPSKGLQQRRSGRLSRELRSGVPGGGGPGVPQKGIVIRSSAAAGTPGGFRSSAPVVPVSEKLCKRFFKTALWGVISWACIVGGLLMAP